LFDMKNNRENLHKIICDEATSKDNDIKWLGITFRLSKMFISYPPTLKLASENNKKEFYKLRSQENQQIDFVYPEINYTISPSDLIKPKTKFIIMV